MSACFMAVLIDGTACRGINAQPAATPVGALLRAFTPPWTTIFGRSAARMVELTCSGRRSNRAVTLTFSPATVTVSITNKPTVFHEIQKHRSACGRALRHVQKRQAGARSLNPDIEADRPYQTTLPLRRLPVCRG